VAFRRQPVSRQPQEPQLRRELREGDHLDLVAKARLVQRDLRADIWDSRVGIGRHQQERLPAESPGAHTRDVGEQLIAAQAKRADYSRRERVRCQETGWVDHI
jgi:hypothetical protein